MPLRFAALCGLLAPLTYTAALLFGGLAQPDAFSNADDDISDLGSLTASSAWIYNRIGANLTGTLVVVFALGLWRALSPDLVGRVGAGALGLFGFALFLEGFLRLDCQGIDANCENISSHSDGHKLVSGVSAVLFLVTPLVLAFAFRRAPGWHDTWLPTLAASPGVVAVSLGFSALGEGAATRAGGVAWFLWLAFVAFRLLRKAETGGVRTEV
jgi:Protein of unknown function (DUF998)